MTIIRVSSQCVTLVHSIMAAPLWCHPSAQTTWIQKKRMVSSE
ncbi:hypothetical protein [Wolbachia endosymbiont of Drosophila pseudotakahashii]|nr:hypothetical protein [Wolbachia endosymbiont of Drosophila pseudotakahashii]MCX3065008.1 hypothetical protein [Wolbachia endosymbiont of Drosophila pseudotakahashii]